MNERKTQATKITVYNLVGSIIIAISTLFTALKENATILLVSPIQNLLFVSLTSTFLFWDILPKLPDIKYTKKQMTGALFWSFIALVMFLFAILYFHRFLFIIPFEILYCLAFSQCIYSIFALICIYINKKLSKEDSTMELDKTITKIIPSIKDIFKSYFDNKENQEKLKFERNNDMHKELEWRQKVYNLEIQDSYTVKDLVILNALINPYDHGDILDNYINSVITEIVSKISGIDSKKIKNKGLRYEAICDVNTKLNEKETAKIKSTPTLFDFPINNGILKKTLNPEQSAKVRECAHLLLKNDWKKQVK